MRILQLTARAFRFPFELFISFGSNAPLPLVIIVSVMGIAGVIYGLALLMPTLAETPLNIYGR